MKRTGNWRPTVCANAEIDFLGEIVGLESFGDTWRGELACCRLINMGIYT